MARTGCMGPRYVRGSFFWVVSLPVKVIPLVVHTTSKKICCVYLLLAFCQLLVSACVHVGVASGFCGVLPAQQQIMDKLLRVHN